MLCTYTKVDATHVAGGLGNEDARQGVGRVGDGGEDLGFHEQGIAMFVA